MQHGLYRRTDASSALESATAFLAGAGGYFSPELAGVDRDHERTRQQEFLIEWARGQNLLTTPACGQAWCRRLLEVSGWVAGNEHTVVVQPDERRVIKLTHPDRFGKAYPRIGGRTVYQEATPLEYLVRWRVCNEAFGDDVWLEQIMIDPNDAVRVVVSQPSVFGIHPEAEDLHSHLFEQGFEPMEAVDGIPTTNDWFRAADRILIFDAHNGNYIQTADGFIVPIDIYAEKVPG